MARTQTPSRICSSKQCLFWHTNVYSELPDVFLTKDAFLASLIWLSAALVPEGSRDRSWQCAGSPWWQTPSVASFANRGSNGTSRAAQPLPCSLGCSFGRGCILKCSGPFRWVTLAVRDGKDSRQEQVQPALRSPWPWKGQAAASSSSLLWHRQKKKCKPLGWRHSHI